MNYKTVALSELNSYAKEQPEYSLAEILYSFLRGKVSGIGETKNINKLSDEDLYSVIEETRNREKQEENG